MSDARKQPKPTRPAAPAAAAAEAYMAPLYQLAGSLLSGSQAHAGWGMLEALLELVPDGITVAGGPPDYRIRFVSNHGCQLLGRSRAELTTTRVGPHAEEWGIFRLDGTRAPQEELPLYRALHHGAAIRHEEWLIVRPDGERLTVLCNVNPIRDADGHIVGAINCWRDITDIKAAQRAMNEAQRLAEDANRAKDRFLASLSHELRTPLAPVAMSVSLLRRRDDLPGDVADELALIDRNISLESHLIDDLLDLTRIAHGKMRLERATVDAHQLFADTLEICGHEIREKQMRVTLDAAPGRCYVRADPQRMHQVLWNLLRNAVKFSHPGGRITLGCRRAGDLVRLAVSDTGVGLSPHQQERIFNAFEQGGRELTETYGGLGLGLAICKGLVDMHEGRIWAESPGPGHGATFAVELPGAEAPQPSSAAVPEVPAVRCRVLLVEDHSDTARLLARILTLSGHEVVTAGSVSDALARAASEDFDVIISDLGLPDGSGLELLQQLRAGGITAPAIALSGYGMDEDVQQSRSAGFAEHLIKPVDLAVLDRAIQRTAACPDLHPAAEPA